MKDNIMEEMANEVDDEVKEEKLELPKLGNKMLNLPFKIVIKTSFSDIQEAVEYAEKVEKILKGFDSRIEAGVMKFDISERRGEEVKR